MHSKKRTYPTPQQWPQSSLQKIYSFVFLVGLFFIFGTLQNLLFWRLSSIGLSLDAVFIFLICVFAFQSFWISFYFGVLACVFYFTQSLAPAWFYPAFIAMLLLLKSFLEQVAFLGQGLRVALFLVSSFLIKIIFNFIVRTLVMPT